MILISNVREIEVLSTEALRVASELLSKLVNKRVRIRLSSIITHPSSIAEILGENVEVVVAYSSLNGMIKGLMLFIMPVKDAKKLINQIISRTLGSDISLDEIALDLFREIANILFGSMSSTAYNMFNVLMLYSVPKVTVDNLMTLMSDITASYTMKLNTLLLLNAEISCSKLSRAKILFMPESESLHLKAGN